MREYRPGDLLSWDLGFIGLLVCEIAFDDGILGWCALVNYQTSTQCTIELNNYDVVYFDKFTTVISPGRPRV